MRVFLAIDLSEDIKQSIWDRLTPLRLSYRNLNWIPQKNYHITLQFFGDVAEDKVPALGERIEQCIFDADVFDIKLRSGDIFIKNSILLYINMFRQKKAEHIVRAIQDDLGVKDDRTFLPHVSVARYKIPSKQQYLLLKKKMNALSFDEEFHVDSVHLYQSILKKPNAEYVKIRSFPLFKKP